MTTATKNAQRAYVRFLKKSSAAGRAREDCPRRFKFRSLWVPFFSSERTATLDLNHDFSHSREGMIFGANGNCGSIYRIFIVSKDMAECDVLKLAKLVNSRREKPLFAGVEIESLDRTSFDKIEAALAELGLAFSA